MHAYNNAIVHAHVTNSRLEYVITDSVLLDVSVAPIRRHLHLVLFDSRICNALFRLESTLIPHHAVSRSWVGTLSGAGGGLTS